MNKFFFNEKILIPLEEWADLGETKNDMGTRLIGHTPHVAPKAYIHIVYASLNSNLFLEFEKRLGYSIPAQYRQFLAHANGLNIFSDALRVMGYIPLRKKTGLGPHDYPSSITATNEVGYIKGVRKEDFVVAWYKSDGSYVSIEENGTVIRFDAQGNGEAIQEWSDFDTWLSSEIAILSEDYKAGKVSIFIPSTTKKLKR